MEQVAKSDDIAIVSSKLLTLFLESLTFTVSFIQEDDGSFTGSIEELDLFDNATSKDECLTILLDDMKDEILVVYGFALFQQELVRDVRLRGVLIIHSGRLFHK